MYYYCYLLELLLKHGHFWSIQTGEPLGSFLWPHVHVVIYGMEVLVWNFLRLRTLRNRGTTHKASPVKSVASLIAVFATDLKNCSEEPLIIHGTCSWSRRKGLESLDSSPSFRWELQPLSNHFCSSNTMNPAHHAKGNLFPMFIRLISRLSRGGLKICEALAVAPHWNLGS